ncbi:YtxH domain-containing protein [Microbispora sp. H11081]|uniref:YtxH domain-containing protein n=1 Tax=Microbispora sp. H11081 TaxID=2729107 RepID=UPI002015EE59|nr:YtxH domain-containing protein [Microbispora sp. H11081]
MRYKAMFATGLAVGYVLGTRAGRERYEQIKRFAQRFADSPTVQEAAGLVGAQASKVAGKAKDLAGDRVPFLKKTESWESDRTDRVGTATGWPSGADQIP